MARKVGYEEGREEGGREVTGRRERGSKTGWKMGIWKARGGTGKKDGKNMIRGEPAG